MTLQVREITLEDVELLLEIERVSYAVPWSRGMFESELAKPTSVALAALDEGTLVGYVVVSRYVDAWHVMNVAVTPDSRRRGIGSTLLGHVLQETEGQAERGHTLEVRVSNVGAQRLYERHGFVVHGIRRGYYTDNREDAVVMWRTPSEDGNG